MEFDLFDTEIDLSTPVDKSQIQTEEKKDEKTDKEGQRLQKVAGSEDEIIEFGFEGKPKGEETEEEEEESKETTKKVEKKPSEQSADSSKFPYSTFTKALYEEGILSSFDETEFAKLIEETGSEADALFSLIEQTISDKYEGYKNSLSPEGREFLNAIEEGVPLDRFINAKASSYSYDKIEESSLTEDDDLCKKLIRDDLKMRGFEDSEIEDQIKDIDDLGKLDVKAKVALKKLKGAFAEAIKHEKAEAERRNQKALEDNKKHMEFIKSAIDKTNEIIPGVKIPVKLKGELYDTITTPAEQLPNGQWVNAVYAKRAKDPVAWDIKVAYLDRLGVFDGKWDKVISAGKTTAVKDLTEKLKSGVIAKTGDTANPEETPAAKDILRSMEVFKKK